MAQHDLDAQIRTYYADHFDEAGRLVTRSAAGRVEHRRTRSLVAGLLAPGSRVLDVGGATGAHAGWLAADGHQVTLIDPVPEQVAAAARIGTFDARVGDARDLQVDDASVDAVLLLGPLYHLRSADDRHLALTEAHRVLRPGGTLVAAGISRIAALLDLLLAHDERPATDVLAALLDEGASPYDPAAGVFPVGHFHDAAELRAEVQSAGFTQVTVTGVEGPASLGMEVLPPDDALVDAGCALAEAADAVPMIRDLSGHLLAVGVRAAEG